MKLGSGDEAYQFNKMMLTGSYPNPAYDTMDVKTTHHTENITTRTVTKTVISNGTTHLKSFDEVQYTSLII